MTEEDTITLLDEDWDIACEAAGAEFWPDTPGPARWIAFHYCIACECSYTFLLCDDCKEFILNYRGFNSCHCGHVEWSLKAFFTKFIPL
jgi:hypothetical protein